jgi:hypothetical protein
MAVPAMNMARIQKRWKRWAISDVVSLGIEQRD